MTLLVTIFASIISTIIWYKKDPDNTMKIGTLCLIYWGASLMWIVDEIFKYIQLREEYFIQAFEDITNDLYLGFAVVALGFIIWLIILFIKGPKRKNN